MKTEIETYQQLFENIDRLSQTSVNILEISEGEDRLFLSACTERLLTLKKLCLMGKLFVEMMVTSRPLNDASPNIQNLEYIYDGILYPYLDRLLEIENWGFDDYRAQILQAQLTDTILAIKDFYDESMRNALTVVRKLYRNN